MDNDGLPLYPRDFDSSVQIKSSNIKVLPSSAVQQQPPLQAPQMNLLGPENSLTTCQFCRASIKTAVKYTTTSRTFMAAALWGMFCCLCCVPFGSESAKNSDHYCPNCQHYLGTYVK